MPGYKFTRWLLFVVLSLIWGSSFILMKRSSETLTGWQIGSTRIFSAGLVFFPFAIFHLRSIPLRKLHWVLISGVLGNLLPAFLFALAITGMESSITGILNSLTPLFVIILGILLFRTRVARIKVIGVLIGFAGLMLLKIAEEPLEGGGLTETLLVLIATFCYGLNINIVAHKLSGIDGFKTATVSMSMIAIPAGIFMFYHQVPALFQFDADAREGILLAMLLGVVGSAIATALYYILIARSGALFASLVTYAIPVVSLAWGFAAGETIGVTEIGCLALILGGVYIANRK